MTKVSIIIPVFNEEVTIISLLEKVNQQIIETIEFEIIVIDDGSIDDTVGLLKEKSYLYTKLIVAEKNGGKGAAVILGLKDATGDYILFQDADLEYDPADYARLLLVVRNGQADAVYGTRFHRVAVFSPHTLVNRALTCFSNLTTGLHLTDMETCYKLLPSEVLRHIPIHSDRFAFEPEITAKLVHLGCRIREVPISYRGRAHSEGKKIRWWDGVAAVVAILRYGVFGDGVRHALRVSKRR